jgi:pSer/pThr/pTyr-binding forkhead associated (FHA) protein
MEESQGQPQADNETTAGTETPVPPDAFLILNGIKAFPLTQAVIKIGRAHDNTLVLDDPRVSRHHLELRAIRDHFVAFDLGSSGGTYVNGQRINQGLLYPGDMISLAGINLIFMQGTHLPARPAADATGRLKGPGERATAIFNESMFGKKKKRGW